VALSVGTVGSGTADPARSLDRFGNLVGRPALVRPEEVKEALRVLGFNRSVPGGKAEGEAESALREDGLSAWHGHCVALEAAIDARLDLARALGALHAQDRSLCAAVTQCPVRVLAERGLGSRASLYRRIAELRCALTAHGLRAA
jgi:RNA polymerase sigma-70 factor (ECF subfamily)